MFIISTGFTVDKHYCEDELKDISFFGKAEECHHESKQSKKQTIDHDCCHQQSSYDQSVAEESNCCSTLQSTYKLDKTFDIEKEFQVCLCAFKFQLVILSYVLVSNDIPNEIRSTHVDFPPPNYIFTPSFTQNFTFYESIV